MQNQTRQILQNSPLFKGLWPDLIDQIAAAGAREQVPERSGDHAPAAPEEAAGNDRNNRQGGRLHDDR